MLEILLMLFDKIGVEEVYNSVLLTSYSLIINVWFYAVVIV